MKFILLLCIIGVVFGVTAEEDVALAPIKWDEFIESIRKSMLAESSKDEIVASVQEAKNNYVSSTQSISEWCAKAVPALDRYMNFLETFDDEEAGPEKANMTSEFNIGVSAVDAATDKIIESDNIVKDAADKVSVSGTAVTGSLFNLFNKSNPINDQINQELAIILKLKDEIELSIRIVGRSDATRTMIRIGCNPFFEQCEAYTRNHKAN